MSAPTPRPRRSPAATLLSVLTLGIALTLTPAQAQSSATPAQTASGIAPDAAALRAGKALFRRGVNRLGGDIRATTGASVTLEGGLAACGRCHGFDAAGRREAGLRAPPLRWQALSQPRDAGTGLAERPAYDQAGLLRALRDGIDAAGRPLAWAMPRFDLGPREQADLLAYLQRVGTDTDQEPGVLPDRLVLATALPLSGPRAALGEAARVAVQACLERANRDGGLYGRRLELLALDSARHSPASLAARIEQESLALIAPWWVEARASELAAALPGVPVLGPLGAAAELDGRAEHVYSVTPQYADQARVLVDDALGHSRLQPSARLTLALISSDEPLHAHAARAAQRQLDLHDSARLLDWHGSGPASARDALAWLRQQPEVDAVLLLGPPDWAETLLPELAQRARPPRLLLSANELGRRPLQWPAAWRRLLTLAVATPSADETDPGRLFADLAAVGEPKPSAPAIQALAYSASCLGVEALRRSGRHVDRESLRAGIEDIDELRTGVTHRLSFAPGRRSGLVGSAIATVEGEPASLRLQGHWRLPRTR